MIAAFVPARLPLDVLYAISARASSSGMLTMGSWPVFSSITSQPGAVRTRLRIRSMVTSAGSVQSIVACISSGVSASRDLIEKKFKVTLGLTTVGELLAKLGLTPQKPLLRAYQRDPEVIEQWQRERYPAIAQAAKREKADVFFWDESGFRADAVHGKTWGVRGQTPVVERPGQRQSISAASAVNAKGAFWFCTNAGALNAELFVVLLRKMMRHRKRPVHLVLDSLPAHKKACVREYVASTKGKLTHAIVDPKLLRQVVCVTHPRRPLNSASAVFISILKKYLLQNK